MANKHVNIGSWYTGTGHAGTQYDPFSYDDFIEDIQNYSQDGDVYNIEFTRSSYNWIYDFYR